MELKIEKLDHHGKGIAYYNGKIVFVKDALIDEIVDVNITKDTPKYMEAEVLKYIKTSDKRVKSKCPFYGECGGCHLRGMSYDDTLVYKKDKVTNILKKYANIDVNPIIIKKQNKNFYRNKLEVKIVDKKVGFYKSRTHEIVSIDRCLNAEDAINSFLLNIDLLHINNGEVTIKTNYNGELIIVINTPDEDINIDIEGIRDKNKLVGIIVNDKVVFGIDHFIEIIDDMFFKESYNSFFQVNREINKELFDIIKENIDKGDIVYDLCCGVGTLSIVASNIAKKVYGIEIVPNAIKDALLNAKMNKRDNVEFMLGDAFKIIDKINDKPSLILIDPPRSGLTKEGLEKILESETQKIIYVSCDPVTLARDLKVLNSKYEIKKMFLLDMFPYTYHVESVVILEKIK